MNYLRIDSLLKKEIERLLNKKRENVDFVICKIIALLFYCKQFKIISDIVMIVRVLFGIDFLKCSSHIFCSVFFWCGGGGGLGLKMCFVECIAELICINDELGLTF